MIFFVMGGTVSEQHPVEDREAGEPNAQRAPEPALQRGNRNAGTCAIGVLRSAGRRGVDPEGGTRPHDLAGGAAKRARP